MNRSVRRRTVRCWSSSEERGFRNLDCSSCLRDSECWSDWRCCSLAERVLWCECRWLCRAEGRAASEQPDLGLGSLEQPGSEVHERARLRLSKSADIRCSNAVATSLSFLWFGLGVFSVFGTGDFYCRLKASRYSWSKRLPR